MLIGEIAEVRDFSRSEAFIWDGKKFKSKFSESNPFFIKGKVIRSETNPNFKIVIEGLLYKVYLPKIFQDWILN